MAIFDLFNKSKKNSNEKINIHPEITLSEIDNGSHGDNIGALIGFENLNNEVGQQFINEHIVNSANDKSKKEANQYNICGSQLVNKNLENNSLQLRVLRLKEEVLSAYPYLKTDYVIPFATKKIIEWSHMNKMEAEITGGGRDTFGFDFFATDYAINRVSYLEKRELDLHVSAFALVLDVHTLDENDDQKYSEDFVAYMPSSNFERQTYYDFIGQVVSFKEAQIINLNSGYIAKVKLINEDTDPDFFTVDMFINKDNMRMEKLSKGLKITGLLWFQGEIAKTSGKEQG